MERNVSTGKSARKIGQIRKGLARGIRALSRVLDPPKKRQPEAKRPSQAIKDPKELDFVLTRLKNPYLHVFRLQLAFGWRVGDILQLTVEQAKVALRDKRIFVIEQKTGKQQKRPVADKQVRMFIRQAIKSQPNQDRTYLFESRYRPGKPISYWSCSNEMVRIRKLYKQHFKRDRTLSTHTFRKTFAWQLYQDAGCDWEVPMRALNHASPAQTMTYCGSDVEKIDDLVGKVVGSMLPDQKRTM